MHGDPDEGNVLVDTAKQVLSAVLPGHKDSQPRLAKPGEARILDGLFDTGPIVTLDALTAADKLSTD
jgi:hypothetical protein